MKRTMKKLFILPLFAFMSICMLSSATGTGSARASMTDSEYYNSGATKLQADMAGTVQAWQHIANQVETKPEVIYPDAAGIENRISDTPVIPDNNSDILSDDIIDLIAWMAAGEAEGEPEYGQRLVIDTVFNRADSAHFPNDLSNVVWQPDQYTAMWNGRLYNCQPTDDLRRLVREEYDSRTNYDVIFFNAGQYSIYGTPMFQFGNHYFSSY